MININDITLGQYAPRDSVVHKLDPRTKVLLSFFLMLLFLWIHNFELLFLFFIILLGFFSLSKLHIGLALRNLKPFLILFLFTCLLHVFFTGGKVLFQIPNTHIMITEEGIYKGIFYSIRIALFIVISSLLTLTTSPMSLTDAIGRFLSPFKRFGIPARSVALRD